MQNLFANCKRLPAVVTSNRNWPFAYEFIGDAGAFTYYRINQTGSFESKSRWRHWPIVFRSEQNGLMTFHRFFQCCSRSKWTVTIATEKFPSNRLNVCCFFFCCLSLEQWLTEILFDVFSLVCLTSDKHIRIHMQTDTHTDTGPPIDIKHKPTMRSAHLIWFGCFFSSFIETNVLKK